MNATGVDLNETNKDGDFDHLNADTVINAPTAGVTGDTSKLNQEIPRANHNTPGIDLDKNITDIEIEPETPGKEEKKTEHFNSEFEELSQPEQDESASQTAAAIIHGYSELKNAVAWSITVSDRKIKKLHDKGEINMYMPVQERRGAPDTITVLEFVHRFNESIKEPFKTSEEFKETVHPILTSILKKKGAVMTPEALLAFYVGQDLIGVGQAAIVAMGDRRDMMDALKEGYTSSKAAAPVGPVTPDVPPAHTPSTANTAPVAEPIVTPPVIAEDEIKEKVQSVVQRATSRSGNAKKTTKKATKKAAKK